MLYHIHTFVSRNDSLDLAFRVRRNSRPQCLNLFLDFQRSSMKQSTKLSSHDTDTKRISNVSFVLMRYSFVHSFIRPFYMHQYDPNNELLDPESIVPSRKHFSASSNCFKNL